MNTLNKHQITHLIASIDLLIERQLQLILNHPKLTALESRWQGLHFLLSHLPAQSAVKIKLLDIRWQEVTRDLEKSLEFDQSQLFQKIYSEEFGTPGGEPFGVMLSDFYVQHQPTPDHPFDDISTLQQLAQIGAAAFAPIVLAPSPKLFGLERFSELGNHPSASLSNVMASHEFDRWRALRAAEDSRFLVLALPRFLLRAPHTSLRDHRTPISEPLWGHACYAVGSVLIHEFLATHWLSQIRGVEQNQQGSGLVTPPVALFSPFDKTPLRNKPLTEVVITDAMERQLYQQGYMALCQCVDRPACAFYSAPTLQHPKPLSQHHQQATAHQHAEAHPNAKLSTQFAHILCGSRFAHYIKVMVRDKLGAFQTATECQHYIQQWLHQYTSANPDLDWQAQAQYPLRQAEVKVKEISGKVGFFLSEIRLIPQYQADQLLSELRLLTELNTS